MINRLVRAAAETVWNHYTEDKPEDEVVRYIHLTNSKPRKIADGMSEHVIELIENAWSQERHVGGRNPPDRLYICFFAIPNMKHDYPIKVDGTGIITICIREDATEEQVVETIKEQINRLNNPKELENLPPPLTRFDAGYEPS